ncbi:MAG: rRNA pseudouridine synthase [Polyangiaceae bacterium]|nr:rRNA pseudouridine synthase [Polyangiaceae bacterium]
MSCDRLQKILARAGVASRRGAEALIRDGRVAVAGRIVRELGVTVDSEREVVEVDGRRIEPEPLVYFVLHKPRGMVTTLRDPEGRPTVAAHVRAIGIRVVPVGRLDYHTSGVLLLTNDGELAAKLGHPRSRVEKEYLAKVRGPVAERELALWRRPIFIDGRWTQPAAVSLARTNGNKAWLSIVLHEGRNRQVRRLGEAAGQNVLRLVRVSFAGIGCTDLAPGQWRPLTRVELAGLRRRFPVPAGSCPSQ